MPEQNTFPYSSEISKAIMNKYRMSVSPTMVRDVWDFLETECGYTQEQIKAHTEDLYTFTFGDIPAYFNWKRTRI